MYLAESDNDIRGTDGGNNAAWDHKAYLRQSGQFTAVQWLFRDSPVAQWGMTA